ncbi:MAG: DNA adenine methylase [Chloroflexota bacterium]|nr:MAG: DNA adenine methylase [Chloroflexota bacterium]
MPVFSDYPQAYPFLKWAGGKRQLLGQLEGYFPSQLEQGAISRYVEPFVGSGAVFFKIIQSYPIQECLIADVNPELILVYQTIQKDVEGLIEQLADIESYYLGLDAAKRREYYYQTRLNYNDQRRLINFSKFQATWIERSAFMLFLNRTGYNGLFRLNSKGEFNVPFGRYKNPRILDAENLRNVSRLLKLVRIQFGDFEQVAEFIDDKTLVYFDPPYRPLSETAHFTAYSHIRFDDRQQLRLARYYRQLDKQGGFLMLSNSDPHNLNPEDDFFEKAYQGFRIERLQAKRNINRNPEKRGPISELLIMNYS